MNSFWSPKLGDVASIDYGVTASASSEPIGPKFLRITDIQDGQVDWGAVPYCAAAESKLASGALSDGDIVFARTGATTGKSFLVRSPPSGAVFASYLIRVRASSGIDPSYLAHYFQSDGYWRQIRAKSQGAAQEGVNASKLADLSIPLPPLDEQRRVAAILDKADALRQKRKRTIALLATLTQSIFLEMFGGSPVRLEKRPVGELAHKVTDGTHQAPNWAEAGVPFLFVSNVRNQTLDMRTDKHVSEAEYHRLTRSTPIEPGDVLYTAVGSYGHTAVVPDEGKFVFQRHIAQIKPNRKIVQPKFLSIALEMPDARRQADALARGNAQKTVPLSALKEIVVSVPPLDHQTIFVQRITSIEARVRNAALQLSRFDDAFASLQHRAFSGQL